jgi:hypothetical protein
MTGTCIVIGRRAGHSRRGGLSCDGRLGKVSYVDLAPKGAVAVQLCRPFVREVGFAWRAGLQLSEETTRLTKPFVVYEDNVRLIARRLWRPERGSRPFFYERGVIWFSVRGDPNGNGRRYWAVVPAKQGSLR